MLLTALAGIGVVVIIAGLSFVGMISAYVVLTFSAFLNRFRRRI